MANFFKTRLLVAKHANHYVPYDKLKILLDDILGGKYGASSKFYQQLDTAHVVLKNYCLGWLSELEQIEEWSPNSVAEAIELNQFVFVNEEALRKIIKKHDKNIPHSQLLPVWKWKLSLNLTVRIIDVLLKAISLQPIRTGSFREDVMAYGEQLKVKTGAATSATPSRTSFTGTSCRAVHQFFGFDSYFTDVG